MAVTINLYKHRHTIGYCRTVTCHDRAPYTLIFLMPDDAQPRVPAVDNNVVTTIIWTAVIDDVDTGNLGTDLSYHG